LNFLVFANKERKPMPNMTWRVQRWCRSVDVSFFIRQIFAALARRRNAEGQVEQGRTSNFTLTLAVNPITAHHYWSCILKSMLLWCHCNLTLNSFKL